MGGINNIQILYMKILYIDKNNALQFHKDNMNNVNPVVFAKYFSPTCPACIAMSDEWSNMCNDVKNKYNDSDLVLAEIDPTGMSELDNTSTYSDVEYVPYLVILKNGKKVKQYDGSRQKEDMIRFLIDEGYLSDIKMMGGKKLKSTKRQPGKRLPAKRSSKVKTGKKSSKNSSKTKTGKKSSKKSSKTKTSKRPYNM